jgi:hypothetical protein
MRRPRLAIVLAASMWSGAASAALAQRPGADDLPPLELGVGVSRLEPLAWRHELMGFGGPQFRATVPFRPRFAFETVVEVDSHDSSHMRQTSLLYYIVVKQRLMRAERERARPFMYYGGLGGVGLVTFRGRDTRVAFIPPWVPVLGVGFDYRLRRAVSVRADAAVLGPLPGVRLGAGLSVPLRGY